MANPNDNGTPKPGIPAKPAVPAQGAASRPGVPVKPAAPGAAPTPRPAVPGAAPRPAVSGQAPVARPAGVVPVKPVAPGQAPPPSRPAVPGQAPAVGKIVPTAPKPAAKVPEKPAPARPASGAAAPGAKPAAPPAKTTGPSKIPSKIGGKPAVPASKFKPEPVRGSGGGRTSGRRLGQVLVDLGYIDDGQLWELLDEAKSKGVMIGQAAMSRGLITEPQLMQALADQFDLKLLPAEELKPTSEALALVPEPMASVYKVLPLSFRDQKLTVVLGDPANLASLDDLRNFLGIQEITTVLAAPNAIAEVLAKCYLGKEESIADIVRGLGEDDGEGHSGRETSIDLDKMMDEADSAPVRKLLNMVMLLAIKDRASDIHFEPFDDEYKLRYRCDGVMYEMVPPPRHLANAISTRIKVMSNLDIAERRVPQDGRIELNVGGNPVDMRVSILPTMYGESCVIRVLDRGNVGLDLNRIGMDPALLVPFKEMIRKPNGIVLVTGPTGSGKTTTLYSALAELNEITDKLITTEDPIEYDMDGIIQVPINADIGVTFAAALRAILRQDPDRILVGEIRDLETAQIAVQSALTGHMVFSTLHTNDAPSTITRLRDMGLETFLITATLEGILAQRLVRKICEDCRTEFDPSPEMLMELGLRTEDTVGKKFYYGKGCDRCNNSGYRGRTGIHELITMNDELRDMVSSGASTDQMRETCRKHGMSTLREAGLRAIHLGITTIDEIVRETVVDND
ncbi:MAG: Flp pilus assembly complex ATPase component TadA [Gemmataceae bacterium]|nr:Flp pilus assembly complex ATPase component TadA [Gemmataceae bacterium]